MLLEGLISVIVAGLIILTIVMGVRFFWGK